MDACLPWLNIEGFQPHALHAPDRTWAETNCYVDLWIEVLHALGLPAEAALGFAARQDFEGDQFSFTKFPLEDLETLFGLRVQELAIYEPVEQHALLQMLRGRMCLIEVDPFWLPDTGIAAYRTTHGKTTIAPNRIDLAGKRMEYFHNAGYFVLEGEDFDGVFPASTPYGAPFRPYVEFTTLEPLRLPAEELRARAATLFASHWAKRPARNPIRAFQMEAPARAEALAGRGEQAFHDFAFHNLRLLGANFDLLGAGLTWLSDGADPRIAACETIAATAKGAQFQLARAVARRRFEGFAQALDPAAEAWERLFAAEPIQHAA
ncbi:DUF1839 family protein [Phenylobacterium deserti]|uniref:DUF1839 domain-containing protein n=1 Tax=Phenylobacterium deserti TaxID=1914756 RepID=A0A328AEB6_9CAUL|nr:DUF1839 family protein [Phenylobacterium deserti]RAK52556.1 DUF1839 domain-containing protein [Phenylobacterium deserti]